MADRATLEEVRMYFDTVMSKHDDAAAAIVEFNDTVLEQTGWTSEDFDKADKADLRDRLSGV